LKQYSKILRTAKR